MTDHDEQAMENPVDLIKRTLTAKLSGEDLEQCLAFLDEGDWTALTRSSFFLDATTGEDLTEEIEKIDESESDPVRFRKLVLAANTRASERMVASACCATAELAKFHTPPEAK